MEKHKLAVESRALFSAGNVHTARHPALENMEPSGTTVGHWGHWTGSVHTDELKGLGVVGVFGGGGGEWGGEACWWGLGHWWPCPVRIHRTFAFLRNALMAH